MLDDNLIEKIYASGRDSGLKKGIIALCEIAELNYKNDEVCKSCQKQINDFIKRYGLGLKEMEDYEYETFEEIERKCREI